MNEAVLERLVRPAGQAPLQVLCSGIGGTGLSGLARIIHALGHRVRGSDKTPGSASRGLEREGIPVAYEQTAANLEPTPDILVITAALPADHAELCAARAKQVPVVKYAEALGALIRARRGIAVAGTHGKTTTTALTAFILREVGLDPGWVVGGLPRDLPASAAQGGGELLVVEACEYDRSFHAYEPEVALVLNVEEDHLDCYPGGLPEIEASFAGFGQNLREDGALIVSADWPQALRVAQAVVRARPDVQVITFGLDNAAGWSAGGLTLDEGFARFRLLRDGIDLAPVALSIPGKHNAANALAAIAAAVRMGADPVQAAAAAGRFQGVRRRFDLVVPRGDVIVVDDYAHHPTAIEAVVDAARQRWPDRRIVACFEPHQASRTRDLFREFAAALSKADRVLLGDIYACRDTAKDVASVSSNDLAAEVRRLAPLSEALAPGGPDALARAALELLQPGDVGLFMGAGRATWIAEAVAAKLPPSPSSGLCKRIASSSFPRVRPLEETLGRELPSVRQSVPLGPFCTFATGGRARFLLEPESLPEAIAAVRALTRNGVPIVPLGGGSNVLFVAPVLDAAVILTRGLRGLRAVGTTLRVGAGVGLQGAIRAAEAAGLMGLQEFAGIPGTVGGAVFGNAGGPPGTPGVADLVERALVVEPDGRVRWRDRAAIGARYRKTALEGAVVLAVDLALWHGDKGEMRRRRLELCRRKAAVQPVDQKSAGCVFKNPQGESAGKLIDALGLKGLRRGGAVVSTLHGNFIVNDAQATPDDVLGLLEEIKTRVRAARGIELTTEVRLIGIDQLGVSTLTRAG